MDVVDALPFAAAENGPQPPLVPAEPALFQSPPPLRPRECLQGKRYVHHAAVPRIVQQTV